LFCKTTSQTAKKEVIFEWSAEQKVAYQNILTDLSHPPVLALFDHKKDVTLYVDASQHGLIYLFHHHFLPWRQINGIKVHEKRKQKYKQTKKIQNEQSSTMSQSLPLNVYEGYS
jgi:hypothetical protein